MDLFNVSDRYGPLLRGWYEKTGHLLCLTKLVTCILWWNDYTPIWTPIWEDSIVKWVLSPILLIYWEFRQRTKTNDFMRHDLGCGATQQWILVYVGVHKISHNCVRTLETMNTDDINDTNADPSSHIPNNPTWTQMWQTIFPHIIRVSDSSHSFMSGFTSELMAVEIIGCQGRPLPQPSETEKNKWHKKINQCWNLKSLWCYHNDF